MRYTWLDEYLMGKRSVTRDLQPEWNWIRYHVGGKMFAAVCLDACNEPYYINLKLEPLEGDFFRKQYEDVIPGYYCNKVHWNSIKPDGEVPDDLLRDMLDKSYQLVLQGFSKKRQREILGLSCCGMACGECSCYKTICQGCNEAQGKVFHAPQGKACPIYECSVQKKKFVNCGKCEKLPCEIWRGTRDPRLSQEEFDQSIAERVENLKGCAC